MDLFLFLLLIIWNCCYYCYKHKIRDVQLTFMITMQGFQLSLPALIYKLSSNYQGFGCDYQPGLCSPGVAMPLHESQSMCLQILSCFGVQFIVLNTVLSACVVVTQLIMHIVGLKCILYMYSSNFPSKQIILQHFPSHSSFQILKLILRT